MPPRRRNKDEDEESEEEELQALPSDEEEEEEEYELTFITASPAVFLAPCECFALVRATRQNPSCCSMSFPMLQLAQFAVQTAAACRTTRAPFCGGIRPLCDRRSSIS